MNIRSGLTEEINIQSPDGKRQITCEVVRSKRRSYGIVVDEEGCVTIRIPLRGSMMTARKLAWDKQDWIYEKVLLQRQRKQQKHTALPMQRCMKITRNFLRMNPSK